MANINETTTWAENIYEIATTDDVIGGSDGISNRQATQLASRTNYLRGRTSDLESGKTPAGRANKLSTARTIAISGDATGSANFDGSDNVTIAVTQKDTGIKAGSYRQVTVDAKGRVTEGNNPTTLSGYGITDAASISYVQATYQPKLGYTPVQQGTGIGQSTNTIKLGWDGASKFKLTVDNADQGNIALESWVQQGLNGKVGGGGINLTWAGRDGQPNWLFGGNTPEDCGVYEPGRFHVAYSNVASNAEKWCGAWLRYEDNGDQIPYHVLGTGADHEITLYNRSVLSAIPTGTRMPFAQATAPTGWTQINDDSTNNRMLRVVNGGGGNYGGAHSPVLNNVVPPHTHSFTTGTISADHTHNVADPGHAHGVYDPGHGHAVYAGDAGSGGNIGSGNTNKYGARAGLSNAGTGISIYGAGTGIWLSGATSNHTHSGATDNGSSQTNWQPRYIDMIICVKN